ncbi:MAG TPA: nitrate- and nitrite sensing domain-containing protein [Burkholderiaceae bacterium]|nr:nitrate- and nitrite sensing domain-containing protein [Burkholderiaceae bacterium]
MIAGLHFLVAAKHCEIADLAQLVQSASLVDTTARLVHGLQRERGLSNLYLSPHGHSVLAPLQAQVNHCLTIEDELRTCYESLGTPTGRPGHGARLFNRVAYAVQGLDALATLRDRVASRQWLGQQATAAYVKLIAGLLAVVFEAADSASDPEVSRLLVTLFNYMQGKELTGQERALGSALFASGQADAAAQQRWLLILEAQTRCFQHSQQFTPPGTLEGPCEQDASASVLADIERLRRIGCTTPPGSPLDTAHSPRWFELCTHRMDTMRGWEEHLVRNLIALCEAKMQAARRDAAALSAWQSANLRAPAMRGASSAEHFFDSATPPASAFAGDPSQPVAEHTLGPLLGKSVLDLVHEQNVRLQDMENELESTRASLQERKLIERAKGLLMAHRNLNEEAAHKLMRQTAMDQGKKMHDVAQAILAMAHVLPLAGAPRT